ncbi:SAM-dependent methyltransferase [Amycolatopsis pigmentata]|uniref:SAM-dependent methyltransferase n=1 Tax=Amycolatopsis pigmentata TaxID=450801 RepID=A0ABW5FYW9_9PSEU
MPPKPELLAEIYRLASATQALAGIGAALRLRQTGGHPDDEVRTRLDAYFRTLLPAGADRLTDEDVAALDFVDLFFEEAAELLHHPGRPPREGVTDPVLLQAQGRLSRQTFTAIAALAGTRPSLTEALQGRILDVGTGAGGLILEAVDRCPSIDAVGIDVWRPALELARANAAASPHAQRLRVRELDVRDLDEVAAYTLAWLPTVYLSRATTETAIERIGTALAPGGYVVLGYHVPPSDPSARAFSELRLARSGGQGWDPAELEHALASRGFTDVETSTPIPGVNFVVARRAGRS